MQRVSVAFGNLVDPGWMAGGQYLSNLLYALRAFAPEIERVLRVRPGTSPESYQMLNGLVERVFEFPPRLPDWFDRLPTRITRPIKPYLWREDQALRRNRIDVQFMTLDPGTARQIPSITWLPDFQHLHYPGLFTQADLEYRARFYPEAARKSRLVILSSHNALEDFKQVAPDCFSKARILSFVAQIDPAVYESDPFPVVELYHLPRKFFFLPNQFWQHKNHRVVIQALALACSENPQLTVVCTGGMYDHRNPHYFDSLLGEIAKLGLHANLRILGRISRQDFSSLMRQSLAILQPSIFEGWSTTVEEAKSLGKRVILSDIPVHHEQNPPQALFFDPQNPEALAQLLLDLFREKDGGPDIDLEERACQLLSTRTKEFAATFQKIIMEAINK